MKRRTVEEIERQTMQAHFRELQDAWDNLLSAIVYEFSRGLNRAYDRLAWAVKWVTANDYVDEDYRGVGDNGHSTTSLNPLPVRKMDEGDGLRRAVRPYPQGDD
jgi:hypothetical protein